MYIYTHYDFKCMELQLNKTPKTLVHQLHHAPAKRAALTCWRCSTLGWLHQQHVEVSGGA